MKFKPGALVMLLKAETSPCLPLVGTFQTLLKRDPSPKFWILEEVVVDGDDVAWHEEDMKVIDPGEGNEDFVTKARKTLPRAKPVTGPVTINARVEVVR
jgi:hypothetical protein